MTESKPTQGTQQFPRKFYVLISEFFSIEEWTLYNNIKCKTNGFVQEKRSSDFWR